MLLNYTGLLWLASIVLVCTRGANSNSCSCSIIMEPNSTDLVAAQIKVITDNLQKVSAVELFLSGISITKFNPEQSTIHNPHWWVWARSTQEHFFNVPALDMDVISFGLLKLSVKPIRINVTDEPSGCAMNISIDCLTIQYAKILLDIISNIRQHVSHDKKPVNAITSLTNTDWEAEDPEKADVLCESHFLVESAFISGFETVGWRCFALTTSIINQIQDSRVNVTELVGVMTVASKQDLQLVLMIIGMILPLILIIVFGLHRWLKLKLLLRTLAGYSTFGKFDPKRSKFYELVKEPGKHDKVSATTPFLLHEVLVDTGLENDGQLSPITNDFYDTTCSRKSDSVKSEEDRSQKCRHWVVIHENALMPYTQSDPFLRLWQHLHTHSLKSATIMFYILLLTMFCVWITRYQAKADAFMYLYTSGQIIWNLNAITISWLFVNPETFTFKIAIFMYCLLIVSLLVPFCLTLVDAIRFCRRRCLRKIFNRLYFRVWIDGLASWLSHDEEPVNRKNQAILKFVLIVYQICTVGTFYLMLCDICHCLIYSLLGIVVHIQTTAPYITGSVLAIYYFGRSVKSISGKYTLLKGAMFTAAVKKVAYFGEKVSASRFRDDLAKIGTDQLQITNMGVKPQVIFVSDSYEEEDLYPQLTYKQMRKIAKRIRPFGHVLGIEFIKLLCIGIATLFVLLSFNKTLHRNNVAIFLTAVVSLLSAMLPKLIELFTTNVGKRVEADAIRFIVRRMMERQRVDYTIVHKKTCKCADFNHPDAKIRWIRELHSDTLLEVPTIKPINTAPSKNRRKSTRNMILRIMFPNKSCSEEKPLD